MSKKHSYFRLNDHVLFVLQANLIFLLGGFLSAKLEKFLFYLIGEGCNIEIVFILNVILKRFAYF